MARSFNGTSDGATASCTNPTGFSNVTLAGWFNASALSNSFGAVIAYLGGFAIFARSTNHVEYWVGNVGTAGAATITTGAWYHVAMSLANGGGGTGYLNGAVDATIGGGLSFGSTTTIYLGTDPVNERIAASLADLAIWNAQLTALEVAGLSRGIRPSVIRPQSLQGYWPLDGLSSPEPDLSGNKNNGTLTGTVAAFGPPITLLTPRIPTPIRPPPVVFTLMPQIVT